MLAGKYVVMDKRDDIQHAGHYGHLQQAISISN